MQSILERNVKALAVRSPEMARRVMAAVPRRDVEFESTPEGVMSARMGGKALASMRRPREEAQRWADGADVEGAGAFVVSGFGVGWHVEALAKRLGAWGIVVVLETDAALLRAVLERVDHSEWLAGAAVVGDADDVAALNRGVGGLEALAALGVTLMAHPAGRDRLGEEWDTFGATVMRFVKAVRTTIATTLMQGETTLRNLLMNADRYVTEAGIADLAGCAAGRAAVVVSAGPSLARNVDLLSRPGVRDRVVIIAVQTVLKTLLARGIKPHYVTALDHHEISRRFYEGLSARDVQGIELVVEPKANAAILEAFPGHVRCAADAKLDGVVGNGLAREMGTIEPGATVAHLAYSLARHLGCDPVITIGQDLGFTDGQYYSAGAAIHQVWAGELNEFRSLEMLEWERIARQKRLLTRVSDHVGRPIYTDEQMHSYLVQFERMFAADVERGLRVIDATEGGVRKRGAEAMTLAEALERFATGPALHLPRAERAVQALAGGRDGSAWRKERLRALDARLRDVRAQVGRVGQISRGTAELLNQTRDQQDDAKAASRLIGKIEANRDEVMALEPGFGLVQFVSQAAALNRVRADRALALAKDLDAAERQRRQIDRDVANVTWLGEASERVGALLDAAIGALGGSAKLTGDPVEAATDRVEGITTAAARRRVCVVIPVDEDRGALGTPRRIEAPIAGGLNAIELTLARLGRCRQVDGVVLLSCQPERLRKAIAGYEGADRVQIVHVDGPRNQGRARAVAAARRWAPWCWRGGVAGLTCYDEVFDPVELAPVLDDLGADAAALAGADWCAIDPDLVDACIARHREAPDMLRLVFSQAAPGLGTCVLSRSLIKELAVQTRTGGPLATIGGLLGYSPHGARADAIAKANCVGVEPETRDVFERLIADSPRNHQAFAAALASLGRGAIGATSTRLARAVAERLADDGGEGPEFVTLELCTGRYTSGERARWVRGSTEAPERRPIDEDSVRSLIRGLGRACPGVAITLSGAGDPLHHPRWQEIVQSAANTAGVGGIHLRTDLLSDPASMRDLLDGGAEVISVDMLAHSRATYASIAGVDSFERARGSLEKLVVAWMGRIKNSWGLVTPWIVPRMTRCDATLGEVEAFYDYWLAHAGACAIDSLPRTVAGERVSPLPVPEGAARRAARGRLTILCDGTAMIGMRTAGNVLTEGVEAVWKRAGRAGRLDAARAA